MKRIQISARITQTQAEAIRQLAADRGETFYHAVGQVFSAGFASIFGEGNSTMGRPAEGGELISLLADLVARLERLEAVGDRCLWVECVTQIFVRRGADIPKDGEARAAYFDEIETQARKSYEAQREAVGRDD